MVNSHQRGGNLFQPANCWFTRGYLKSAGLWDPFAFEMKPRKIVRPPHLQTKTKFGAVLMYTPPKFNIAPEKSWLLDEATFGIPYS